MIFRADIYSYGKICLKVLSSIAIGEFCLYQPIEKRDDRKSYSQDEQKIVIFLRKMVDSKPEKRPKLEDCLLKIMKWKSKIDINQKYMFKNIEQRISETRKKQLDILPQPSMRMNELNFDKSEEKVHLKTLDQATGISKTIHDQKDTYLCHTFALMTILRTRKTTLKKIRSGGIQ